MSDTPSGPQRRHSSFGLWKALLIVLALASGVLTTRMALNWQRGGLPEATGTLAATFGPPDRDGRQRIQTLAADSPLRAAGSRPGDAIRFEQIEDASRVLGTDETVDVSLFSAKGVTRLQLSPTPSPDVARHPVLAALKRFTWIGISFISTLIGLLIGLRRADSVPMRFFAIALILVCGDSYSFWLPAGPVLHQLTINGESARLLMKYSFIAIFALTFPERSLLLENRGTRWAIVAFGVSFVVAAGYDWAAYHRALNWPFVLVLPAQTVFVEMKVLCSILTLVALWLSWRRAIGTVRQRLAWIGLSIGVISFSYLLYSVNLLLGEPIDTYTRSLLQGLIVLTAYICLGYAILRYRLFDFGVVINRALVFTITSLTLILVFFLLERAAHHFLHFEDTSHSAIFDSGIAFSLFFVFNRLHHRIDHWVEHLLFREWRVNTENLKRYLAKAAHYTDGDVLLAAFGKELDRFTGGASHAIYRAASDGSLEAMQGDLAGAPPRIDVDDDLVVTMRQHRQHLYVSDTQSTLPGECAFPMMQGGRLIGLVLLGKKPRHAAYRPDEQDEIAAAAAQIGLDLSALRGLRLEQENNALKMELAAREDLMVAKDSLAAKLDLLMQALPIAHLKPISN